jgi:hypothetical protein
MELCHLYTVLFVYSNNFRKQMYIVWLENFSSLYKIVLDRTTTEDGRKLSNDNMCKLTFETTAFTLSVPLQF